MLVRVCDTVFFFLMIRRPPRSTLDRSSAASDVYKRQRADASGVREGGQPLSEAQGLKVTFAHEKWVEIEVLSLIHISEPTRPY